MAIAEYVDNLPPIPYIQSPIIKGALINFPLDKFRDAIESDPKKQGVAMFKRGGKPAQELLDTAKKCESSTLLDDEGKAHCFETLLNVLNGGFTITFRDYYRAVYKQAGYSFDKSLVTYANDCYTFGSCSTALENIVKLTNNPESLAMVQTFVMLCSKSNPDSRKRFLPSNVAAACIQIMSSAPLKSGVCERANKIAEAAKDCATFSPEVARKINYCNGAESYPEIDCD